MKPVFRTRIFYILTALLLCTVFLFTATGTAHAMEIITGGTLPAGQTVDDDVIISGDKVVIDGNVNGTLMAFGSNVTINGDVSGDVIAMGGLVILNGKVAGNVFSGAQTIQVNGEVTGSLFGGSASLVLGPKAVVGSNVYYGGYSFEAQKGSAIQRDLAVGGYQVLLKGDIARDAHVGSGALELDGKVGRNLNAEVEAPGGDNFSPTMFIPQQPGAPAMPAAVSAGMRIGPEASIGGKLTYTSSASQAGAIQAAPAGGVVYQTPVPKEATGEQPAAQKKWDIKTGFWGGFFKFLREIIALMVFGSLAIWLIYPLFKRTSDTLAAKPLPSLGAGFIVALAGYAGLFVIAGALLAVVILLAIFTLGGVSGTLSGVGFSTLALIGAVFTFLVSFGSKLVFALLAGQRLLRGTSPTSAAGKYGALAVGVLIYALAHAVPYLGWLVAFIVTLLGLGAMWYVYQASRPAAAAAPAVIPAPQ